MKSLYTRVEILWHSILELKSLEVQMNAVHNVAYSEIHRVRIKRLTGGFTVSLQ